MKQLIRLAAVTSLVALTGAVALSAPLQQAQLIEIGETTMVSVSGEGPENAVTLELNIAEPTYVTFAALSTDGTDPVILLRDAFGRDLITINDNPSSALAATATDAVLDNTMLIPGRYTVLVGRNTMVGGGEVSLSVLPGAAGVIGAGDLLVLDGAIGANERYTVPVELVQGQIVSFAALGLSPELDLRMNLRGPEEDIRIGNDDNETFDVFLTDLDPRIYQFSVPVTGEYLLTVRAFSGNLTGEFKIVIQNHGMLSGEPTVEVFTGESDERARNIFFIDFEEGEVVRITARADSSSLDPEIDLLSPDMIYVATNDDHGTEADDLGRFDARIERVIIEQAGTYELDINSVSGRGGFEVVVERQGRFTSGGASPLVAGPGQIITPQPTIVPEVTAEPTSNG